MLKKSLISLILCLAMSPHAMEAEVLDDRKLETKILAIHASLESGQPDAPALIQSFPDPNYLSHHTSTMKISYNTECCTVLLHAIMKNNWPAVRALLDRNVDLTVPTTLNYAKYLNYEKNYAQRLGCKSLLSTLCFFAKPFGAEAASLAKVFMGQNGLYDNGVSVLSVFASEPRTPEERAQIESLLGSEDVFLEQLFSGPRAAVLQEGFDYGPDPKKVFKDHFTRYKKWLMDHQACYEPQGMLQILMHIEYLDKEWALEEKDFLREHYPLTATTWPTEDILTGTLHNFPPQELWRLFVDGYKQRNSVEKGWEGYEKRELGCVGGMISAFSFALQEQRPLSLDMYENIHRICLGPTTLPKTEASSSSGVGLGLNGNLSLKGFLELKADKYKDWVKIINNDSFGKLWHVGSARGDSRTVVQKIISDYNSTLAKAGTQEEKLKAIIEVSSDLNRFHLYEDGNGRVAIILAQRELIRNGFSPTVLDNPNQLDGFSQEELLQKFLDGMVCFDFIKTHGKYPGAAQGLETSTLKALIVPEKSKFLEVEIPDFWKTYDLQP